MRKRSIVATAAAILAVAAAYCVYWFMVAAGLSGGLEPWAAARRAEGFAVAWDKAAVSGFPFAFRLTFTGASFGREQPTLYIAKAPLLVLSAMPWNLHTWHAEAPQGGSLATNGAALDAQHVEGSVTGHRGAPASLDVTATVLAGRDLIAGVGAADAEIHLALPASAPADHHDTAADLSVDVTRLSLPATLPPFGKVVDDVSLAATLKGRLAAGAPSQSLAAWRDDGGTLELTEATLHWGQLKVDATGTLALDGDLQPIGSLTATIEGQNEIVDAAVSAGSLRARDAGLAKIVLGVLARPGPDGRPELKAPIRIQDGHLSIGPAKIAALPRITWR
jgi:hypothetical protein